MRIALLEPAKYGIIGVLNTGLDIALFLVLIRVGLSPIAANTISFSCGAISSYLANSRFTFRAEHGFGWPIKTMFAFFGMTLCNVLLSNILLKLGLTMALTPALAKAASLVGTFLFGFIVSKFVIFTGPTRRIRYD
jgi:putative flippase GtrA